ncbi:MAG: energy transducer TonB [Candidatus Zhuqueibacterota bacterium]
MTEFREKNAWIAAVISLVAHGVLLLIFALYSLHLDIEIPDLTEISFVSGPDFSATQSAPIVPASRPTPVKEEVAPKPELVNLPLRKMLEKEAPELKDLSQKKQIPAQENLVLPPVAKSEELENAVGTALSNTHSDEKEIATSVESLAADQKLTPSPGTQSDAKGQAPYEIEGDAAARTVTAKMIPAYPENLQKEATIKIRFSVLPSGRVGEMLPIIKSDAALEKLTLDALRQWQFNPLPTTVPQRIETGIITFRYLLK